MAEPPNEIQAAKLLLHFNNHHLPPNIRDLVEPFRDLALRVAAYDESHPETVVTLKELIRAKDAMVRVALHSLH